MNNLYHKVAVASVFTALSFTLGANKEAKAATFQLTATEFFVEDIYGPNFYGDGVGDRLLNSRYDNEFYADVDNDTFRFPTVASIGDSVITNRERRAFYEFNIGNLSLPPNTAISSAIFYQVVDDATRTSGSRHLTSLNLEIFGYVGNGRPDLSDFGAGVLLGIRDAAALYPDQGSFFAGNSLDVTPFINERVSNRDAFAGFGIRVYDYPSSIGISNHGVATLYSPSLNLTINTVDVPEPVPEPTTIFGSAIGLCLGGWVKRKKLTQQNKTTPQP